MPKNINKASEVKTKLPSAWFLTKDTLKTVSTFWRSLAGVLVVYAILYFVLVMGFSLSLSWQQDLSLSGGRVSNAVSSIFSFFGSRALGGSSDSGTTTLMQFLLFIIASLAFVWALRCLRASKSIKVTDAYYLGASNFIQTIIVSIVLLITFIPLIIGSGLLSTSMQTSTSGIEVLVVSLIAGVLLLISFYFLAMLWPAFYIAALPGSRPWAALKSAAAITKKLRLVILGKVIFFTIAELVTLFVIIFLVALILPPIVPIVVFLLLVIMFGLTHIYLYSIYRKLI